MIKKHQVIDFISYLNRKFQFVYYFSLIKLCDQKEGLIIIGCGRSGTTFTSKKLKSLEIYIGHERLNKHGISSWYLVSDQTKIPIGPNFKQIEKLGFSIVHQVRNPLSAISSMQASSWISFKFLSNEIPIDFENDSKILKAMKYWYYWNLKAEAKAILSYQIEKFNQNLDELLKLGKFTHIKDKSYTDTKTNTRNHIDLSWDDLYKEDEMLTNNIKNLAIKYGYKI
jgi:hypothetical protein